MNRVDLSKAPKGSTHYLPGSLDPWRQQADGFWNAWAGGRWVTICDPTPDLYVALRDTWNGEGLPPVGAACEALVKGQHEEWREAVVIWHHPNFAQSSAVAYGEGRLLAWASRFRPIRTLEQIAEAAKQEAIAQLIADTGGELGPSGAALLYSLGYRKQVES